MKEMIINKTSLLMAVPVELTETTSHTRIHGKRNPDVEIKVNNNLLDDDLKLSSLADLATAIKNDEAMESVQEFYLNVDTQSKLKYELCIMSHLNAQYIFNGDNPDLVNFIINNCKKVITGVYITIDMNESDMIYFKDEVGIWNKLRIKRNKIPKLSI